MKNKLHKLLDPATPENEQEAIIGSLIKNNLDTSLRAKWEKQLSSEFGLEKSKKKKGVNLLSTKNIAIFTAMAACLTLLLMLPIFTGNNNADILAEQYLQENEFMHPGLSKGVEGQNEIKETAIQAFNAKKYKKAAELFENLTLKAEEDYYYLGLAHLLNKNYKSAIPAFEAAKNSGENFRQEINWFQSLTYLLNKEPEQAKTILVQIGEDDWNYTLAQKMLDKIDD